jgi:hypothetical protein
VPKGRDFVLSRDEREDFLLVPTREIVSFE